MSVISICGICLLGTVGALVLREIRREYVPPLVVAVGVIVMLACLPRLSDALGIAERLASYIDGEYAGILLRALGVAYLTSTAAELCKSSGEAAIAPYIETFGKLEIVALSLPVFSELFSLVLLT